ncbi:acyltransferase [Novosphingobium cyanobacteriorum]|uniref:Acyltransferase n=1 Tax=Novosphingobium cyanobacteriorum TaxID=3024215 RepID=A0ABT6CH97_9SPHN|nr:acyltransferase [Novosphingobium cyanobacteriorum]MDF8333305.1 acyltransferase [Novosphingobium cyanobacteriorum]
MAFLQRKLGELTARIDRARRMLGLARSRRLDAARQRDLEDLLARRHRWLGHPGFPQPSFANARLIAVGPRGHGNCIVLLAGAGTRVGTAFHFARGARNNILVIGARARAPRKVDFLASHGLVVIGEETAGLMSMDIELNSDDGLVSIGPRCNANGTSVILQGVGQSLIVGEDCMFAMDTVIRTSDRHAISGPDGQWMNPPADIRIDPHVWLGEGAFVLKGVHIGTGAVVAARSVVSRNIPPFTVAGGAPTRPLRSDIYWERSSEPTLNDSARWRDVADKLENAAA